MHWVESTLTPSLLTNSIVGMAGFVDLHKVSAKRKAFLTFWNAWNGVELEGEVESKELKCQFSQVEKDLDLQKIFKPIPISNRRATRKKVVVIKDENEKNEIARKEIHCVIIIYF